MSDSQKLASLKEILISLYADHAASLPYHGFHHITFVSKKTRVFAASINANLFLAESAALVHDLNYLTRANSEPEEGHQLRKTVLFQAGYTLQEADLIERIVLESHTGMRNGPLSAEGMALSDADTLFKALPITPILLASRYIKQNKVNVAKLAQKITSEQKPLFESGVYFYTEIAKEKYLRWAETNLHLWENVKECLKDSDVQELILKLDENS